jgi:hypothetical protein
MNAVPDGELALADALEGHRFVVPNIARAERRSPPVIEQDPRPQFPHRGDPRLIALPISPREKPRQMPVADRNRLRRVREDRAPVTGDEK